MHRLTQTVRRLLTRPPAPEPAPREWPIATTTPTAAQPDTFEQAHRYGELLHPDDTAIDGRW